MTAQSWDVGGPAENVIKMPGWNLQISFDANDLAIRGALQAVRKSMQTASFEPELMSRVEMVLAELFNNIAEHAYAEAGKGEVRASFAEDMGCVTVAVHDRGQQMPGGMLPDGRLPDTNVPLDDLPEGGFGWHIIRTQSDFLTYARESGSNVTKLRFDLSSGK